ncbi:exodeoxyribonuclease VII large subunit [Plasticicumulans lactativorans]|uniref:Exodeoxyribonuclease 7 large subunit n=1 Tax=Plasticicumulans lactativorans TaxID=1133106 RepID=A0A4R2L2L0_9GAMM|nr:exodeoxyribonuclease VII large subunit [Plasticicumulans lactativorans]TCO80714.1 exodeoxyribonuclease VII large subunit [Plasticicumulans lactativorans]
MSTVTAPERDIYSVTRLNRSVRSVLESEFTLLWVEGEVSNLSRPASGHLYFSLKDADAQVRCAMFRTRVQLLREPLANGQKVVARARVTLYEPRGDFQLVVEHVEAAGAGDLRRRFDELRLRLAAEGLFDAAAKRPLPRFPRRIGVITSASGAALHDVLTALGRRHPGLPVCVYPTPVQGEGAAARIAAALATASRRRDCDVLLLVRGGGSLEDLWAFNEEIVARAIRACALPVVSGVGHETDVTIADFAADLRAATPTAAAELASPAAAEWRARVSGLRERLARAVQRRLALLRRQFDSLGARLDRQAPTRRLQARAQRLDELESRLRRALRRCLERRHARLALLRQRLAAQSPGARLHAIRQRLARAEAGLGATLRRVLERRRQRLLTAERALQALSPLATLGRGYAIVRDPASGRVLRRAGDTAPDARLEALLGHGSLQVRVSSVHED